MISRLGFRFGIQFLLCFFWVLKALPSVVADDPSSGLKRSWVNLSRYSGRPCADPVSQADFRQLAFELQDYRSSCLTTSLSSRYPYAQLKAMRGDATGRVPFSVIHWDRMVEQADPGAMRTALAEGVAPALALTNVTVFAFAPVSPKTYRGADLALTLDSDDLFEDVASTGNTIESLIIDAGDGGGWRLFLPGEPVAASYETTGTKTIRLEAILADGAILDASATLDVLALTTPHPTETISLTGGKLYLYKTDAHVGLRCPVFVVEGFDMNNDMGWDALYAILNEEQLVETLRSYGRDLAVLDFTDATQDIFTNAGVAIAAINKINALRTNPSDKFTVIGASMGGLVSRHALAKMDKYPATYGQSRVNTWISFDSPQEGANIPLGLQEFFAFFGGFADDYSDLAMALDYKEKVDSPAAQEMLLCHYKANTPLAARSPAYASFDTTMKSYGYPTSCKKIAITNGSKFGTTQPYAPAARIVHWSYSSYWTVDIGCDIYSLNKSSATSKTLFYGMFDPFDVFDTVDETVYKYRYYPCAVDNAAGGTRSSFQEMFDSLPSDMKSSSDYCLFPDHCFIPTTSALGIPKEYIDTSVADHPAVLALSPFDEVHCAAANEPHIDINASNKAWFMRAILENYDSDGDGFDDYQEYLMGTDCHSATSRLSFATGFAKPSAAGAPVLSWAALPNVLYKIYFAESLGQAWTLVNSVSFSSPAAATFPCPFDSSKKSGFFKVTATVVDPVGE